MPLLCFSESHKEAQGLWQGPEPRGKASCIFLGSLEPGAGVCPPAWFIFPLSWEGSCLGCLCHEFRINPPSGLLPGCFLRSFLSRMVISGWMEPFLPLAVLLPLPLPQQPECCPLWQALCASILQLCVLLRFAAAHHHHLMQFLGKPVQPVPRKGWMGHPAMSRSSAGGGDVLCPSPPRYTPIICQ